MQKPGFMDKYNLLLIQNTHIVFNRSVAPKKVAPKVNFAKCCCFTTKLQSP